MAKWKEAAVCIGIVCIILVFTVGCNIPGMPLVIWTGRTVKGVGDWQGSLLYESGSEQRLFHFMWKGGRPEAEKQMLCQSRSVQQAQISGTMERGIYNVWLLPVQSATGKIRQTGAMNVSMFMYRGTETTWNQPVSARRPVSSVSRKIAGISDRTHVSITSIKKIIASRAGSGKCAPDSWDIMQHSFGQDQ